MMSWWSSWVPTWPTIDLSLPSGIQRRFISFALRRSLGHFLKPGQLDLQQIDSQIGAGYVQIRDLELSNDAINSVIGSLPLQLHDGAIGKVTARIPWPNPLTSTIGLSVESLHLTFYLSPNPSAPTLRDGADLTESMFSVAESFIHEELSAVDETTLRSTIPTGARSRSGVEEEIVPGGLDPFMSDEDLTHSELEPPGVSIFATLIEKLLARFAFDADDVKVTVVFPQRASFTLSISQIRYGTESAEPTKDADAAARHHPRPGVDPGNMRTVSIRGITVTTRCLRPGSLTLSPTPRKDPSLQRPLSSVAPLSPQRPSSPSSPYSDSSDIDEDTQMLMSESIAVFPPRSVTLTSSAASSMYQSAVSTTSPTAILAQNPPIPGLGPPTCPHSPERGAMRPVSHSSSGTVPMPEGSEVEDEMIVSFGSDPILIRLSTPSATPRSPAEDPDVPSSSEVHTEDSRHRRSGNTRSPDEKLRVNVEAGLVAVALRARHIRNVMDMTDLWGLHPPPAPRVMLDTPATASPAVDATLRLRGTIFLLLPASTESVSATAQVLDGFFSRPLVPPQLPHGFVRVHLEELAASASLSSASIGPSSSATPPTRKKTHVSSGYSYISCNLSLAELSAFAFLRRPTPGIQDSPPQLYAHPILITDPHLPSQYPRNHAQPVSSTDPPPPLPNFEVVDWTDSTHWSSSARLSIWRTRAPQHHNQPPSSPHRQETSFTTARTPPPPSGMRPSVSPPTPKAFPRLLPSSPGQVGLGRPSISPGGAGGPPFRPTDPALNVKFRAQSPQSRSYRGPLEDTSELDVVFEPLHVFVDLGLVMVCDGHGESATMIFLRELTTSAASVSSEPMLHSSGYARGNVLDEDGDTPPATPRVGISFGSRTAEEQEQERRRLERLVIDDLDLGYDYPLEGLQKNEQATTGTRDRHKKPKHQSHQTRMVTIFKLPMIRIQMRDTPPSLHPRSGAVIFDLHEVYLSPGRSRDLARRPSARFAPTDDVYAAGAATSQQDAHGTKDAVLYADWQRIVIAYAPISTARATAILSLGPSFRPMEATIKAGKFGDVLFPDASYRDVSMRPHLQIMRGGFANSYEPSTSANSSVIAMDIPSIYVELSKPVLDGLQLWTDDLTRLIDTSLAGPVLLGTDTESRDSSIIGSRFFAKSRSGSSELESVSLASKQPELKNETAIKVTVGEGMIRLLLPREEEGPAVTRPFDIVAHDIDVLVELKPEGKDETVITVGIWDISLDETTKSGFKASILCLTQPHTLAAAHSSALKIRFISLVVPETSAKESRAKVTLRGLTFTAYPDLEWISNLVSYAKTPPGAFESVVPSERTRLSIKVVDMSLQALCPTYHGALVPYIGELDFSTVIEGNSPETRFSLDVPACFLLLTDDVGIISQQLHGERSGHSSPRLPGLEHWKRAGFALIAEIMNLKLKFLRLENSDYTDSRVTVDQGGLRVHLCADTMTALTALISDFTSIFAHPAAHFSPRKRSSPTRLSESADASHGLLDSLDEHAFHQLPEVGAAPDMIYDDLPTNPDYLDVSFGAAAGLRELEDDEFDETDINASAPTTGDADQNASAFRGETIRMLRPGGLRHIVHYFDNMTPDSVDGSSSYGETTLRVRLHHCDVTLLLYDGYDWARTRRIIEEEKKEMRKRLAKIRQLVASGQIPDPSVEETNTLLFNSVYIGLEHNVDELDPGALIAAIDDELNEDMETASQSSWQSLKPQPMHTSPGRTNSGPSRLRRKHMSRSKGPNIEFSFKDLEAEIDRYRSEAELVSRTLVTIEDVEILDHIKTSTWHKFLTSLRADPRGNIRETGSNMVRVELRILHPVVDHPSEEARLRAKILPLRLHVDQDALDFLKRFFGFNDPTSLSTNASDSEDGIYFQHAEVFPVDIKLDYKPRRVDYRALRNGRTIELMNFFHFDGAEMTLRHITLTGISGWSRFFDLLNDLWTPDVKATQLVDVISGVSPIRSVVNVGSGVADLVLLPIAQYKKDGRVVRGLQKGTTAFVKSTAMEAIKLGARLATGTQVILEQAENVIGGQFKDPITTETVPGSPFLDELGGQLREDDEEGDLISRYAEQPMNVQEGLESAYRSLRRNFNSAAQTILAVPMEVYERSGNEGPVRAVVRAVPIAVLKPMIGASEAVSKTLLGLHNQLDPSVRHENEAKYKQR